MYYSEGLQLLGLSLKGKKQFYITRIRLVAIRRTMHDWHPRLWVYVSLLRCTGCTLNVDSHGRVGSSIHFNDISPFISKWICRPCLGCLALGGCDGNELICCVVKVTLWKFPWTTSPTIMADSFLVLPNRTNMIIESTQCSVSCCYSSFALRNDYIGW